MTFEFFIKFYKYQDLPRKWMYLESLNNKDDYYEDAFHWVYLN